MVSPIPNQIGNVREKGIELTPETAQDLINRMSPERVLEETSKVDPFIWIYQNVPTEHGRKLEFYKRPYLKDILRDFSPQIAYKKSAQVGITMCGGIAKCLYAVDTLGITSIYTFPTARDVGDFSNARFRNIIESSRYLSTRVGKINNVGIVAIGESHIYFKGSSKESQSISVPSDLNVHDELDFSDPTVREAFSSRLEASNFYYKGEEHFGWEWDFSTPTLPRFGISSIYEDSDQHEWWVRCSRCRRSQRVDFFKNMRKTRSRIYFGCRKCDKELERRKGVWKPRYPGRKIRGYHITQPMCAYISAERMADKWKKAQKTSEGKRKFYNFNLGLEYEDGSETISRSFILSRVVESTVEPGPIYIGADQGDVLHVVVSKVVNGVRRHIWIDTVSSFDTLERLIDHYNPRICVIDALPNHHNARYLGND